MHKINVFFLIVLMTGSTYAECKSTPGTTKCFKVAELEMVEASIISRNEDTLTWLFTVRMLDGQAGQLYTVPVTGYSESGNTGNITCHITHPFNLTFKTYSQPMSTPIDDCANGIEMQQADMIRSSALTNETCPSGFYTMPYDESCGPGLVETENIAICDNDTSGRFCLIQNQIPCQSGISTLQTTSGINIPLWADKYTEHSLAILYNTTTCHISLAPGTGTNTINILYQDQTYHAIK